MKLSEIARYWAARELTRIERPDASGLAFHAPFACPQFTVKLELSNETARASSRVRLTGRAESNRARRRLPRCSCSSRARCSARMAVWWRVSTFPKGASRLELAKEIAGGERVTASSRILRDQRAKWPATAGSIRSGGRAAE